MENRRRGESKADAQRIPGGGAPTPILSGRCSPPPDRNHPIPDPLRSIARDLSRSVPAKKRPFRRVVGGGVVLGSIQLGKSTRDTQRGTRPSLPFRNRGLKGIIGPVQPIPDGRGGGITQPARLEKIPVGRGGIRSDGGERGHGAQARSFHRPMRKYLRSPSQRVGPGVGNRDAAPIEPNTNPFKGGSVSRFPTNRRPSFPSDASPIDPTWKGAPAVRAHISTRIDRILEISERAGRVQVDTREISPTQPGERRHGRQERNGPTA
eukprot:scaffold1368_cov333-Pavlova_lutheri.AAC.32